MVWCIIFGVILGRMKERARYVLDMMAAIHLTVTKLIYIVMWSVVETAMPVYVCACVCVRVCVGMNVCMYVYM